MFVSPLCRQLVYLRLPRLRTSDTYNSMPAYVGSTVERLGETRRIAVWGPRSLCDCQIGRGSAPRSTPKRPPSLARPSSVNACGQPWGQTSLGAHPAPTLALGYCGAPEISPQAPGLGNRLYFPARATALSDDIRRARRCHRAAGRRTSSLPKGGLVAPADGEAAASNIAVSEACFRRTRHALAHVHA